MTLFPRKLDRLVERHRLIPLKIALLYALFGGIWILFSDHFLSLLVADRSRLTVWSTVKGWVYVAVTAGLLYWLITRYADEMHRSEGLLRERNEELTLTEEELQQQLDEQCRNQLELHEAHQTLNALFNASPVAVLALDGAGTVTMWNQTAELLFGWPAAESVGMPHPFAAGAGADDFASLLAEALAGAVVNDLETCLPRRDGQLLDISMSAAPTADPQGKISGIVVLLADNSRRKCAERALVQSEENYRLLFASNPHPMWVFDRETLAFLEVNDAAITHYGYSREEFLAMTIRDIRPTEEIPALLEAISRITEQARFDGVWRHRLKNGTEITVEVISHAIDFAGRQASLVLANDVTERFRMEKELVCLNAELEERVRARTVELERANRELESFSYSVSHDLRAPLRHISGFSRALLEDYSDRLDAEGLNYLNRIQGAAQRMGGFIDDMLKLANVSRSEMEFLPVNLSTMAQVVALELKQGEPARQVTFRIAEGVTAIGDARLLRVIMENLLGNAWKYTSRRDEAEIEFGVAEGTARLTYFIRDNGVGFDMAYAGKLFQPFQRLHGLDEFEGSGIGLATVRRAIERHGGEVWAEAGVDRGATFFFTIGA